MQLYSTNTPDIAEHHNEADINHEYENQPGELTDIDWWSWKVEII